MSLKVLLWFFKSGCFYPRDDRRFSLSRWAKCKVSIWTLGRKFMHGYIDTKNLKVLFHWGKLESLLLSILTESEWAWRASDYYRPECRCCQVPAIGEFGLNFRVTTVWCLDVFDGVDLEGLPNSISTRKTTYRSPDSSSQDYIYLSILCLEM